MLINWTSCKRRVLHIAEPRDHKFTRVSDEVRLHLDRVVGEEIVKLVNAQPNMGKTITMGENDMNKAFITGSHAYGTPRIDSDIDIVMLMSEMDMQKLLTLVGKSEFVDQYGDGQLSLRFGLLNLIICYDQQRYDNWKVGTELLKQSAPCTRESAIEVFEKLFETET